MDVARLGEVIFLDPAEAMKAAELNDSVTRPAVGFVETPSVGRAVNDGQAARALSVRVESSFPSSLPKR
jgi:hypothetical protein